MGILGALFGGSRNRSTSRSTNRAFDQINNQFTPAINAGVGGITQLGNELSGGFDDYLDKSGFDFALGEGLRGVTRAGAAKGLLRSGGTSKSLAAFADGLKRQAYDNYLGAQANLGQLGLGAGGLLANAGQESMGESRGRSQGGILSSLFSDREIKTDIVKHGELFPGIGLYSFRYIGLDLPVQMGVIAQEVERVVPEAVSQGWYAPLRRAAKQVNYETLLEYIRAHSVKEAS